MEELKNMTGYPSIDKPWLKYYSQEATNVHMPNCSMYSYMMSNNIDYQERTALVYLGRKISYGEMFEKIDLATKALQKMGLKKGDIVSSIAITIPETVYLFYAMNRLGIISNWIDPRSGKNDIEEKIKKTKSKLCFVFEQFWNDVAEVFINMLEVQVVLLSLRDSAPVLQKIILNLKNKKIKEVKNVITYKKIVEKGIAETVYEVPHEGDSVAVLEYTGGTTGKSKAVMLTNENCNAVCEQYRLSGAELAREHSWLAVAFPFVAYSLICSMHMPLSFGMTCYLCFSLDVKNVLKLLLKNRINHMANTPLMWEQIIYSKEAQKADFSFLINPTVGADSLDVEREKKIESYLREHGCRTHLAKGYGMTEVASGVSTTVSHEINKLGSVGIPMCQTTVAIFDWDTGEELPYGKEGEICICGPSVMKGYYEDTEQTELVLKRHGDGKEWIHSGDIGYIDEDGFLFIKGRMKRMIVDCNGFKIFPPLIESMLMQIEGIEKICIVGVKDKGYQIGEVPVAFVVKSGTNQEHLKEQMLKLMEEKLPNYYKLNQIYFVDDFPYTGAGKVDYRELEREANNIIRERI